MSSPAWRRRRRNVRDRIQARRERQLVTLLLTGAGSTASSRAAFEAYTNVLAERFAHARQRWIVGWDDVATAAASFEMADDWRRVQPLPQGYETTFTMLDETAHLEWTTPADPEVQRKYEELRQLSRGSWGTGILRSGEGRVPESFLLPPWSAAPDPSEDQHGAG